MLEFKIRVLQTVMDLRWRGGAGAGSEQEKRGGGG